MTRDKFLHRIALVIVPIILFSPVLFFRKALFWGTVSLQFVPWRSLGWEQIIQGILPLWNPLVGMGAPLAANYQSAFFYPPNWIFGIFQAAWGTPGVAWSQALSIVLHLIWASWGASLFAKQLKFKPLGQTVTGLSFGLSNYLVARAGFLSINTAAAWIPWVVLGAEQMRIANIGDRESSRNRQKAIALFVVCLAMQLLSGHAQTTWYCVVFTSAWVLFWSFKDNGWRGAGKILGLTIGCGLAAFLLAGIQTIPTLEYLLQSQRSSEVGFDFAANYSFWPWHLINLVAPGFFGSPVDGTYWYEAYFHEDAIYIGLIPLILAVSSFMNWKPRHQPDNVDQEYHANWLKLFLGLVILLAFTIALGGNTPVYRFLYTYVPTFDMFQAPTRWTILAVFSLSILAGLGVETWRRPVKRGLYWSRLGTAGAFAVCIGSGIAAVYFHYIRATFLTATALAGFWALIGGGLTLTAPKDEHEKPGLVWTGAVIVAVSCNLLAANWGLNPGKALDLYRADNTTANAVREQVGSGRVYYSKADEDLIKYAWLFRVESFEPINADLNVGQTLLADINMLDGIPSVNNYDPLVPARYARWINWLNEQPDDDAQDWLAWMGVSSWLRPKITAEGYRVQPIESAGRFRWITCPTFVDGEDAAWDSLTNRPGSLPAGETLSDRLIVEGGNETPCETGDDGAAAISVMDEKANKIVVQVESDSDGWLVQADTWYPGWVAEIDGTQAPVYRGDFLFRAIPVPAGEHQVVIAYKPASFTAGVVCSLVASLAIIGFFLLKR